MPAYVKVAKSSEIGPGTAELVEAKRSLSSMLKEACSLLTIRAPIVAGRCRKVRWLATK